MSKCENCVISKFNTLNALTTDELKRMTKCKTSKIIKKGEVLFEEGEYVNGVYCVRAGICKVSKMSDNGKDQIIHLIKKGDLLGERSLLNNEAANLKATAISDMEVCFIPKEEVLRDLEENHSFTLVMLKKMAQNLKEADDVIVDMAQKNVQQRLAQTLLNLDDSFNKKECGAIDICLSRDDIASIIGTATETAIRILSRFKKQGILTLKGKSITIHNRLELQNISEGF